jgi:hypothetical protein
MCMDAFFATLPLPLAGTQLLAAPAAAPASAEQAIAGTRPPLADPISGVCTGDGAAPASARDDHVPPAPAPPPHPRKRKQRLHYHEFMLRAHQRLHSLQSARPRVLGQTRQGLPVYRFADPRPAGGGGAHAHAHTRAGGASDDTPESPPAPAEGLAGEGSAREARAAGVHHVPPTARPRGRLLSGNTHCQQSQHLPSRPDLLSHSRGCGLRLPLAPPRTYPSPTVFPCFQAPTEARSCSARGRTTWHCAGGRCPGVPRRCRRTTGARCWCRWSRGRRTHTAS